jgi:uncharacterized protein (DUF2249 family)
MSDGIKHDPMEYNRILAQSSPVIGAYTWEREDEHGNVERVEIAKHPPEKHWITKQYFLRADNGNIVTLSKKSIT